MMAFPIEKKRLMVIQDIQAEAGIAAKSTTPASKRGGSVEKDTGEKSGPEYYVRKLSEPDPKGYHAKTLAHLGVSLRTMPLR